MNYQNELDALFSEWKDKSLQDGLKSFCADGLMNKGLIKVVYSKNEKYWIRQRGNENELWNNAPKRIMFLNKDLPNESEDGQDIREWIFRQHETDITHHHYKNISLWLYGLLNVDSNNTPPKFNIVNDKLLYSKFMDDTPIAYVNCKKESGKTSISNKKLIEHINLYQTFIIKEINILNPDIIVCGGGSGVIKDFLIKNVYKESLKINNWFYYNLEQDKLIIDSFHPSYFGLSQEEIYNRMMENYCDFLNKFPNFKIVN